jgi:uncharacterized YccA/Bax inhibitor family protein
MMRTANPALNDKTFAEFKTAEAPADAMTIQGTVNKTAFLLLILVVAAGWVWKRFMNAVAAGGAEGMQAGMQAVLPWVIGGAIGGLIIAIVTVINKRWARATVPFYAALEGLFLGGLSAIAETQYPGIVVQAVGITFGILFSLLVVYKSRLIKVTENFKLGVAAATGGIFLVYIASWILGFFGIHMPLLHSGGWMGIGFSLFIVVIASLNLVLDFDFIENAAQKGAPKYMEWFGAFGLLVTLVWLYIEILRLLMKLRER